MTEIKTITYGGEIYYSIGGMQYTNASRTLILDLTPEAGVLAPYLRWVLPYIVTIIIGAAGLLYISV